MILGLLWVHNIFYIKILKPMVVSFSFLSDALDSIDYTIKFQFFFSDYL